MHLLVNLLTWNQFAVDEQKLNNENRKEGVVVFALGPSSAIVFANDLSFPGYIL